MTRKAVKRYQFFEFLAIEKVVGDWQNNEYGKTLAGYPIQYEQGKDPINKNEVTIVERSYRKLNLDMVSNIKILDSGSNIKNHVLREGRSKLLSKNGKIEPKSSVLEIVYLNIRFRMGLGLFSGN